MLQIPSELQLLNIYLPPGLVVVLVGLLLTLFLTQLINALGLARFFWHPPLAFVALWVISSSWFGLLFVSP